MPGVCDVLDVVAVAAFVDVVARAVVVVADIVEVVEDELVFGLFEQAANATTQAGRSNRLVNRFRRTEGMAQCMAAADPIGGLAREQRAARTYGP